jgi:excisionase family DNA binding protein
MTDKRLTMTIPQAAKAIGIGRNQGYEAARLGQIPTIKIGKRLLVPVAALENKLLNAGSSGGKKPSA